MEDLLFSVAIITYNQEKYISQTLDSILQQRHSFKYEIVIGDDCSTDGTQEIIKKYAEKYPDIIKTIFNNQNLGIIKNYFNVINHCSGKYIMECAGDDYWLPGKVQTQIDFMEQNPEVGMCYGYAKKWLESKNSYAPINFGDSSKTTFENLINGNDIPAPTVCFKNELIKRYVEQINPVEKNWKMEDFPEWLWFSKESKISFIEKELAVYRTIEESASHSINLGKKIAFIENTYNIIDFFRTRYDCEDLDLQNRKNLVIATNYLCHNNIELAESYLKKVCNIHTLSLRVKYLLLCIPVLRVIVAKKLVQE